MGYDAREGRSERWELQVLNGGSKGDRRGRQEASQCARTARDIPRGVLRVFRWPARALGVLVAYVSAGPLRQPATPHPAWSRSSRALQAIVSTLEQGQRRMPRADLVRVKSERPNTLGSGTLLHLLPSAERGCNSAEQSTKSHRHTYIYLVPVPIHRPPATYV